MPSELRAERRGAALVLTLSDPASHNSLSAQVFAAGVEALNTAETDADVRCIVLHGEGDTFSAGLHVPRLARHRDTPPVQSDLLDQFNGFIEALRAFPKPVIAAVEGTAAAGGFSLALACDLIVAAADARFVLSHGRLGLSPDGGASWHLLQALPRQRVLQWLWLGEPLTTDDLRQAGLVARTSASGAALDEAIALADHLAQAAPNAIASAKELVQLAGGRGLTDQLRAERDHVLANLAHDNGGEGLQAFLDHREPRFE